MVIDLDDGRFAFPCPAVLKTTFITPVSPGFTGAVGRVGIIQSHEASTLEIFKLAVPVFLNLYE
jgi:hypothetical protein